MNKTAKTMGWITGIFTKKAEGTGTISRTCNSSFGTGSSVGFPAAPAVKGPGSAFNFLAAQGAAPISPALPKANPAQLNAGLQHQLTAPRAGGHIANIGKTI